MTAERPTGSKIDIGKTLEVLRKEGISLDIDGVETETGVLSVREYNLLHGIRTKNPKTIDDVKSYWIMVDWIKKDPLVEDHLLAAVDIWNSQWVLENARPVQGVRPVTKFLERRKIFPYRITARPGRTRSWTHNWYLKEYGSSFNLNLIRMQGEEGQTVNPDFKAEEIIRLGIGYHFDDSFENAELIVKTGATVILVPQPWNLDYQPQNENIIKVNGFKDRAKMVRAFLTLAERITTR